MAVKFRGEVDLTGGSGESYHFRLGAKALCQLMDEFEEPTDGALFSRISRELSPEGATGVNTRVLRSVVAACVNSGADANDVIDDCGEGAVIDAIAKAVYGRAGLNPPTPTPRKRKKAGTSSGANDSSEPPK